MAHLRDTIWVRRVEAIRFLGIGRRQYDKLVAAGLLRVKHFFYHTRGPLKGKPKDRGYVRREDVLKLAEPEGG